jgi:hypothetical protein
MPVMLIKKPLLKLIREGKKRTTVRLGKRTVSTGPLTFLSGQETFPVQVFSTTYKTVAELTLNDAVADGFESLGELLSVLRGFYPEMRDDDVVTIVHFSTTEK